MAEDAAGKALRPLTLPDYVEVYLRRPAIHRPAQAAPALKPRTVSGLQGLAPQAGGWRAVRCAVAQPAANLSLPLALTLQVSLDGTQFNAGGAPFTFQPPPVISE